MSGRKQTDQLIREAEELGLTVERHGKKWKVSGPGGQKFLPLMVHEMGRTLDNVRADLRRIAAPTAMVAAFASATEPTADEQARQAFEGWDIGSLLKAAESQGVTWRVSGGVVSVVGPPEAEAMARLIRDRAGEILAFLNPPTVKDSDMAQIRDMASVSRSREDLPRDAEALWEIVRIKAYEQGDQAGTNAGIPGVLWSGALTRVMGEFANWDAAYRKEVATYLEQTGHTKCQSKNSSPPVWWVALAWNNGDLKVTPSAAVPVGEVSDDELLALLAARLRHDSGAAGQIAELKTANDALRSRIADLERQLAEKTDRLKAYDAAAAIFRGGA